MAAFAIRHAYLVIFIATAVEQLGLPLPVAPLLLGAGALARTGQMQIVPAVTLYLLASAISHLIWSAWDSSKRPCGAVRGFCWSWPL